MEAYLLFYVPNDFVRADCPINENKLSAKV